uniref:Coat protein n=2 Tax=Luffa aphid-borne yellows virus TaxID=1462682 RepID=A0A068BJP6_9VIRU|nr:coat protein [Luffa aphid-borne yellows virus]AIC85599.1 coat protein [Luffa aphid-borne yellows virus]AIC85602.1 coat protein [Luffa aphid-borne yellows virus]AIC85608.1 coat protein [Luffa aphid-borne yellows virus]
MNTAGGRRRNGSYVTNRTLRNRRRRQRRAARVRNVIPPGGGPIMVLPNLQSRRRRNRRNRRRRGGGISRGSGSTEVFKFILPDLKGNSAGTIKFGPSLSQKPEFATGILKSYARYKISQVTLSFRSEASATDGGALVYQLDTTCAATQLDSKLYRFSISNRAPQNVTWRGAQIRGEEWHSTSSEQFWVLYQGNGEAKVAGSITVTMVVNFLDPK